MAEEILQKLKEILNREKPTYTSVNKTPTMTRLENFLKSLEILRNESSAISSSTTEADYPLDPASEATILDLSYWFHERHAILRSAFIVAMYALVVFVSLFGNILVCHVVLKNRKMHTVTNTFIANLAVSDLLLTCINIPFNVARILLDDWVFGSVLCRLVPFAQVISVYVSSFTMTSIALDRYQVIVNPLKPRLSTSHGIVIISFVWMLAILLSLPYALYHEVVPVFTYKLLHRCQARFPSPALEFRKWLTLSTFLMQYCIPLSVTAVSYVFVARKVWFRKIVGTTTREQLRLQTKTKKKTIKMLMVVVLLFAVCWLPLNMYHILTDWLTEIGPHRYSSGTLFACHWLAMSNVCYNPFIYCWLNESFRSGAKRWVKCNGGIMSKNHFRVHPGIEINGDLVPLNPKTRRQESTTSCTASCSVRSQDSTRSHKKPCSHFSFNGASDKAVTEQKFFVPEDLFLVNVTSRKSQEEKSKRNSPSSEKTRFGARRQASTVVDLSCDGKQLLKTRIVTSSSDMGAEDEAKKEESLGWGKGRKERLCVSTWVVECVYEDKKRRISLGLRGSHSV